MIHRPERAARHLDGRGPRIPALPQEPPAGQRVPVVGQVRLVLTPHVHREDRLAAHRLHDVSCQKRNRGALLWQVCGDRRLFCFLRQQAI